MQLDMNVFELYCSDLSWKRRNKVVLTGLTNDGVKILRNMSEWLSLSLRAPACRGSERHNP